MPAAQITLAGNLAADPTLRVTPKGHNVVDFSVVTNRRAKVSADSDEWADYDTSYWRCVAWGAMAENVADSLAKGDHVVVVGTIKQEQWTDADGNTRYGVAVKVDHVGPDLRRRAARPVRTERTHAAPDVDQWTL